MRVIQKPTQEQTDEAMDYLSSLKYDSGRTVISFFDGGNTDAKIDLELFAGFLAMYKRDTTTNYEKEVTGRKFKKVEV